MRVIGGAGPGNPVYFTKTLDQKIKTMDKILAFERISKSVIGLRPDTIVIDRVSDAVKYFEEYEDVLLLASGDPNFFGIVELIKRKGIEIDEVIPGISSLQYFASRIQKSYSNIVTRSVHGRDFDFSKVDIKKSYSFLIDKEKGANYISEKLQDLGHKGKLYCGYNLSYDSEEIYTIEIGDRIEEPTDLGIVVVEFYVD